MIVSRKYSYDPIPIGSYVWPRIAVAQGDLDPRSRGDIATLISSRPGSLMISWENVQFCDDWYDYLIMVMVMVMDGPEM